MIKEAADAQPQIDLLWEVFADTYPPLPFHGPQHPQGLRPIGREVIGLCKENDLWPDAELIDILCVCHDSFVAYGLDKVKYARPSASPDQAPQSATLEYRTAK